MLLARMTLSLLLMALILPWGAYVNAASLRNGAVEVEVVKALQAERLALGGGNVGHGGRAGMDVAASGRIAHPEPMTRPSVTGARVSDAPSAVLTSWLRCRKAHLPGSVCGPHVVLPGAVKVPPPDSGGRAATLRLLLDALQLALPPPKSPPRSA
ncbi:hypothetical protein DL237_13565 [Pseudooceanicola sediminis]|uniref:Uncharacterized protein n=1 Tax=Pseudooceanicola sediminis TaxID=2211117 RepID=A0A399J0Q4_9RHOB|nr:hypothetical protein [Pseudooceanicola sediminis]RII38227.1 hypothetical protein DL237_13565 [Pseudooceanicola sediminis]|tara:strand:+ start:9552 stop:10016 length:465 start_codon:yes stop_codon:yes gene_type:complete